mgnify:CR=1 FL=1
MTLTSLYRDYFQKSRVFLYPILEIKRGVSVTPIETYISWDGHYKTEDRKFIVLYHLKWQGLYNFWEEYLVRKQTILWF